MLSIYDYYGNARTIKIKTDPELKQRNEKRLLEAKQKLGTHYLLHPESTYAVKYKDRKFSESVLTDSN